MTKNPSELGNQSINMVVLVLMVSTQDCGSFSLSSSLKYHPKTNNSSTSSVIHRDVHKGGFY